VTKIAAPRKITLTERRTSVTATISVTIQNRGDHEEMIPNAITLDAASRSRRVVGKCADRSRAGNRPLPIRLAKGLEDDPLPRHLRLRESGARHS